MNDFSAVPPAPPAGAAEPAIVISDVAYAYGKTPPVLLDCNLAIARGRVLALLGPNGSGKTTLLKLTAGALRPTHGTITVRGNIGYVPQLIQTGFAYTVIDMVLMGRARQIGTFATPSARDEQIALRALERVGMAAFARRTFDALSGGERQLIVLARALAAEADILVLDEPMAALDLRHQQSVLQWMHRLAREDGLTVIFSTHQPQHADVVADDVALMTGPGRMIAGPARDVLKPELLAELFGIELVRAGGTGHAPGTGVLVPKWKL